MEAESSEDKNLRYERLELALRASSEGIWDWQAGTGGIYYSNRTLEFLECGSDSPPNIFLAPHERIHPEDRPIFARTVRRALETTGPETLAIDARVETAKDEPRWLRIRGTIVRDSFGKVLRIAGSMIDISLRKRAEAQLEEERFLLRQLIDHIPVQVYFKDKESRFVLANQGMAEWMGLESTEQLLGKHDRDFFQEQHWKDAEEDEKGIMETGQPVTEKLEEETWREKGEQTWVVTSKFPWNDRLGTLKGTFGVSSDVTEIVRARQEAVGMARQLQFRNEAYEEELQLAREIQQALADGGFPKIAARGASMTFGSRYIPISGLAGDFFEVLPISETQVGLLICDVMGHGVRAALVVAMLRGLLEKQRSLANDPALFLRGLNDGLSAILERAGTTMFATAFYAVVDLEKDTLRFSSAGHPGAIASGPDGVRQFAGTRSAKGPALGLIRGVAYPVTEARLSSIDRMILFTDGVLEAENLSGEPFFEKRLIEIIATQTDASLDRTLDSILSSVLEFSEGRHFDDDVCLLGLELKRNGAAAAGLQPAVH